MKVATATISLSLLCLNSAHEPTAQMQTPLLPNSFPPLHPNHNKTTCGLKTMKTLHSLIAGLRPASLILARRIALPLLFLGAGLMLVRPCAGAPFEFEETGSLATARVSHTATALPNGKVLVAGGAGINFGTLASAELYDPASGTWTTTGSLASARAGQTATLLPNGKVLVAAGFGGPSLASAELYDPASGTWTATGGLAIARYNHTATLLPNGKVLVAGGWDTVGQALA